MSSVQSILEHYDNIEQSVIDQLEGIGISTDLPEVVVPDGISSIVIFRGKDPFVGDITSATDVQIGMLMSFFTNWTLYVHTQEEKLSRLKKIRKEKLARLTMALKKFLKIEKKIKAADLDMEVETYQLDDDELPVFVKANASLLEVELLHGAVEQRHKDLRTVLNLISREQSRRASDFKNTNRSESINNYSSKPSGGSSRW